MAYKKSNANGQAAMANSEPVVIASDQSAVPVSGTVTANIGTVATLATTAKQDTGNTSLSSIDTKTPALGQALAAASTPVVLTAAQVSTLTPPAAITGFATETTLGGVLTTSDFDTKTGSLTEGAPASDTASSGLNGRLQRIAQRITSLIALLPTSLGANGGLKIEGVASGTAVPVSIATAPALIASSAIIGKVGIDQTTPGTTNGVQVTNASGASAVNIQDGGNSITVDGAVTSTLAAETTKVIGVTRTADGAGNLVTSTGNALDVNIKTSAASNISTNLAQVNGVTTLAGNGASGTGAQRVTIASDSTGQLAIAANATSTGTLIYKNTALVATKQAANASGGNLYGYHIYNPNSATIYVQFFNVASASVTVGTTAADMILAVPAGGWADSPTTGPAIAFGTALTVAATTTATGSTAPTTGLLVNLFYK